MAAFTPKLATGGPVGAVSAPSANPPAISAHPLIPAPPPRRVAMPHASAFVPMLFEEMIAYTDGHSKLSLMAATPLRSRLERLMNFEQSFNDFCAPQSYRCQVLHLCSSVFQEDNVARRLFRRRPVHSTKRSQ